ncbi:hypothetical protein LIER_40732 [Lithospermum erythrorhizon]|uniref:Uncharacterized protein n=1 Tax=Lithospermum erythrorhizon TaxID=34254 RepID=A0AAV3QZ26_LITER
MVFTALSFPRDNSSSAGVLSASVFTTLPPPSATFVGGVYPEITDFHVLESTDFKKAVILASNMDNSFHPIVGV